MKAKEKNAPIEYARENARYWDMEIVPYSKLQEIRPMMDNTIQSMHEMIEAMDEQSEEEANQMRQALLMLDLSDSLRTLDQILDKRKDAIKIHNEMFPFGLFTELSGAYQFENMFTILKALATLTRLNYNIRSQDYRAGLANVCQLTGLMGRWQKVHSYPDIICDTGHNVDGIEYIHVQLNAIHKTFDQEIHIVFGMVNDKDIRGVLRALPKYATYYLSEKGFYISSGLAHGIDEAAHRGGLAHHRTIAVTGTGLDTVYPSQNSKLAQEIIQTGALVTEFLPTTLPLQQHFPRRNRIVSGLSLGVLVVEAALKSGSLITANEAANQGKMVFAIPGHIYSEYHQGCHQLIREGATLVDHPEQIIEDLALPTQWQVQQQIPEEHVTITPSLPTHLIALYQSLDWVGQDLDELAQRHPIPIAELTAQLMELELLGFCIQQGGRYLRCRPIH
jgi:DNA protecting protein DprA